jgi:predicted deacylase
VSESLDILCSIELPTGEDVPVCRRRFGRPPGGQAPHVAVVAGVRGDAPEGTRVALEVARHLRANVSALRGTVDVYPCVNPLAAHHGARAWPAFDVDLNRRFPGRVDGHAPDRLAAALVEALRPCDVVIELRGAHPAFREAPQAHVRVGDTESVQLAMRGNVRVLWARDPSAESRGPLLAVLPRVISLEGGTGNRLTEGVGLELCDGVLNMLAVVGIMPEEALPFHWAAIQRPVAVDDARVVRVRASRGGLFLPGKAPWAEIAAGAPLGEVVDPITGDPRETVLSPVDGRTLAVREQPVVYPGTLVARVVSA